MFFYFSNQGESETVSTEYQWSKESVKRRRPRCWWKTLWFSIYRYLHVVACSEWYLVVWLTYLGCINNIVPTTVAAMEGPPNRFTFWVIVLLLIIMLLFVSWSITDLTKIYFLSSFLIIVVTLDYKTLLLLLVKKDDEEFALGGRGVDVEFCFLCDAIRVCFLLNANKK